MRFTTIFFDLDDTLYPASSGLWPTLKERMTRYMVERMNIPPDRVPAMREEYFREYGITLRGLQANHAIDTDDYLAYVHDVQLSEYLQPNQAQQDVLSRLPTRNFIFTNADAGHVRRVLDVMQIGQYFIDIIDINRMEPHCKPSSQAFGLALQLAAERDPARCAMIDDLPHTTQAATRFGMYSILFGAGTADGQADAACPDWPQLSALLQKGSLT